MIRRATWEDTTAIVRLAGQFLATSAYGRLFAFESSRIAQLVELLLEQGIIYVATRKVGANAVEIVGFIAALEATDPYSGLRYADEIAWFVMPEARNSSIGPRLLASLERWAIDKRLSFVKMVAPAASPDVARFYQTIGFEPIETAFVKRI